MLRDLVHGWWLLHIRGILTIAFGAFLLFLAGTMDGFFTTTIALVGVMLMFIFYLIASGALSIAAAFKSFAGHERFWTTALHGSILLALGLWLLLSSELTVMWMVWFTVANALVSGLVEVTLARTIRRHVDSMLLAFAGAISAAIAMFLIFTRNAHMSRIVSVLGCYAIFYGAVLFIFSLRLHGISRRLHLVHHN